MKSKFHIGSIPSELVFLDFRDEAGEPLIVKPFSEVELSEEEHVALVERVGPESEKEVRSEEQFNAWKDAIAAENSFDDLIPVAPVAKPTAKKGG